VPRKNAPHNIFVDLETERDADGVCNSWTTESGVSPLEINDGINHLL